MADDLSTPLGQQAKKKRRPTLPFAVPQAVAVLLGLCLTIYAGWALMVDDPYGGEPVVVVATATATKADVPMPAVAGAPATGPRSYDGPVPGAAQTPPAAAPGMPGSQTITIIDGSTGKRQDVPIAGPQNAKAPIEQRLLETTPNGAIPRIAQDGARPADVYARPMKAAPGKGDGPRIAIIVGGLGISAAATQEAMAKLPGAVTLAFAPYGFEVDKVVTRARADGHEILLQVPMEPFDYPDNDPGPQTLLLSLTPEQNLDRMYWLMSRIQGYVGVVSFMGARFTSSEAALAPVLREMNKRGLIYVDDGASPRSLAGQIATANSLPFTKADVVIDSVPTPVNIDRALTRLEGLARERGAVVGIASALPASIDRIAQWAKALESRGVTLVPVTAIAVKPKSS